ncbi:MAG: ATP-binding protein [Candidatus Edwardsbacteria bacterium]
MKETIKTLLYEWKKRELPDSLDREIDLSDYLGTKPLKLIVITGFRRVGKTYLLYNLMKRLLISDTKEEIVYLNFEDERIPLKTEFITVLLPTIKQLFEKPLKVLFLDEIQNMPEWSKWLRRVYESEKIRIFVTGSSSKMSSKEIPTELRGRFFEVKVFPLTFNEFLTFRNLSFDLKVVDYVADEKTRLLKALDEYLRYGAMPEVVLSNITMKSEIINSYYQTVVRRDIIERNKVENEEALKALLRLLLNSTSYSISKLHHTLKSLNYPVGKATLQKYLSYIENAYFMFSVPIFSYKIKNQLQYPRKVYFIDTGFINRISTKFSNDYGRLYENIVAITLLRDTQDKEIYHWKQNNEEVDFVVKQDIKVKQLIQVCYDITDVETKKRETRALIRASQELKCKNLLVITEDYEADTKISWFGTSRKIRFIPLWKWLLG